MPPKREKGSLQFQQLETFPEKHVDIRKQPKYCNVKESMFCWHFKSNLLAAACESFKYVEIDARSQIPGSCRIKMGRVKQAGKRLSACLTPFSIPDLQKQRRLQTNPKPCWTQAQRAKRRQRGRRHRGSVHVLAGSRCFSCKR